MNPLCCPPPGPSLSPTAPRRTPHPQPPQRPPRTRPRHLSPQPKGPPRMDPPRSLTLTPPSMTRPTSPRQRLSPRRRPSPAPSPRPLGRAHRNRALHTGHRPPPPIQPLQPHHRPTRAPLARPRMSFGRLTRPRALTPRPGSSPAHRLPRLCRPNVHALALPPPLTRGSAVPPQTHSSLMINHVLAPTRNRPHHPLLPQLTCGRDRLPASRV